jgi:hypothetical protein
MHDICMQAMYHQSATDLYNDDNIKDRLLLSYEKAMSIWRQLSIANQSSSNILAVGRREDFVYEELQSEYNVVSRNLTIRNREGNIEIVIDDDKVFGQNDPKKDTYGLKYTQHVKDNRKGYTCHCAATTCTLFPIGIHWEHEGESSHSCIEKILTSLFRHSVSGYLDLRHVTLFSDRGYWTPTLVFWLLSCGAFVVGTLIRALCWPITYNQEKKGNDLRTFLNPKGPPSLYLTRLQNEKTRNQRLTIGAFRSGTDNISLAMSSKNHANEWDCILLDPKDYDLYRGNRLLERIFRRVDSKENDEETEDKIEEVMAHLSEHHVNAITILQGTVDWKYARRFSFTSATSYDIIKVCLGKKCWHLFENKSHFRAVKAYLDGSFPSEQEEDDEQQQQENFRRQNQDSDSEYDESIFPETTEQQVKQDIYLLNSDRLSATELRSSPFYSKIDYFRAFIKHVTRKSDASSQKTIPTSLPALRKLVDMWLDEPNKEQRKYFFLKVEGLQKAMAKKFGMNWKTDRFPGRAKPGEKDLLEHLGMENSGTNNDEAACKELLLTALFKQTFFPPLKGDAKEAASIGHRNEKPIVLKLSEEVPEIKAIFGAPLVEKIDQPWVKDSADFITVIDDYGLKIKITEIKTRTSVQTASREYERVNRVNAIRHGTINATSPILRDCIANRGEALQLLHHSLTYNSDFVWHVVGSAHGQIISSVRVQFSASIRDEYAKCLEDLKNLILPWAYDRLADRVPEDLLQLAETSLKDLVGGRYGLVQQFCMWRELLSLPKPLPPLRRIIPAIHAEWNIKKTASDTITKLIDGSRNQIKPPSAYINANTLVSARTINYALVTCHRLRQLFSSSPEKSESLRDFRNAANLRFTYKQTIKSATQCFRSMIEENVNRESTAVNMGNKTEEPNRRVRIQGELTSNRLLLPAPYTSKTPNRNLKQRYESEDESIPKEIIERRKNCKGPAIFIVPQKEGEKKAPKKCFVCDARTNWWCTGCHHYFCMNAKNAIKVGDREPTFAYFNTLNPEEPIVCTQLFCWHQSHRAAFGDERMPIP